LKNSIKASNVDILGVDVAPVSIPKVIDLLDVLMGKGLSGYVTVTGVHGLMKSQKSTEVKIAHEASWLTVPDGMPLVYIGRLLGYRMMRRCYGPDLMAAVAGHSVEKGYTHFFYGGNVGVAELLKKKMKEKFPGIKIVGTYTPPFRPLNSRERSELINTVEMLRPDFFWVGLSTPKQELFMREYSGQLKTKVMFGVGAAFDFHTGNIKSANPWIQKFALEWLFRLLQEPKRLYKRYLVNNPLFIINLLLQLLKLKKF